MAKQRKPKRVFLLEDSVTKRVLSTRGPCGTTVDVYTNPNEALIVASALGVDVRLATLTIDDAEPVFRG